MKRFIFIALAVFATARSVKAQDNIEAVVAADVVNQYIWRGQDLGDVSLQPSFGAGYKGLSLSAWGSVGLSVPRDTKEFDITASYSLKGWNIGITDYWFNTGDGRYFLYDAHSTAHVFEAFTGYDFSFLSLRWYTNIGGADGVDDDGERAYSSYVELGVPFSLGGADFTATLGAVPYATSFYGDASGFAVTNVGLKAAKEIAVGESFSLPVFAGITANPSTEKAYLIFGFTISP